MRRINLHDSALVTLRVHLKQAILYVEPNMGVLVNYVMCFDE